MKVSDFVALLRDYLGRADLTDAQLLGFTNLGLAKLQRGFGFNYPKTKTQLGYVSGGIALPANWKGFPNRFCVTYIATSGARTPAILSTWENISQRRNNTLDGRLYAYSQVLGGQPSLALYPDQTGGSVELVFSYNKPAYQIGDAEDEILAYGHDLLLLSAIAAYNVFSQEEQKVPLDASLVANMTDEFLRLVEQRDTSGAIVDR